MTLPETSACDNCIGFSTTRVVIDPSYLPRPWVVPTTWTTYSVPVFTNWNRP